MIVQINVFVCEQCGVAASISEEVSTFSDPVVVPPEGWTEGGDESHGGYKLRCPKCSDDWLGGSVAVQPDPSPNDSYAAKVAQVVGE